MFAGPHHCIATARSVSDDVFRRVRDACAAGDGTLTLAELDRLKAAYDDALAERFDSIRRIHDRCMTAVSGSEDGAHGFDTETLLAAFLYAHTADAVRGAFGQRLASGGADWLRRFYRGFVRFVTAECDPAFPRRVTEAYARAGASEGAGLSVGDLVHTPAARAAVRASLAPLVEGTLDRARLAAFGRELSIAVASPADPSPKFPATEIDRFLVRLQQSRAVRRLFTSDAAPVFIEDVVAGAGSCDGGVPRPAPADGQGDEDVRR